MVRDVLGSLLLLGGALWLWLGLVQAQRRQLRLLEELAASLEQMASAIRFRRETLLRLLAAQRQRPLAGPYYGAVLAALEEGISFPAAWRQGFVGLCLNALLPEPSLAAIYLLGIWDGFFASLGVTALLAATPALVGRENLMQAGAITMLTVRLGSVISPMIGGLLLATGGVAWNFGLAAAGTFITTLTLLRLPQLPPPPQPREHPLRSLLAGLTFLCRSPLIGGIALLGGLLTMASAVRVLYPALAGSWQMSAGQIGLLYAAIPLGAALGALTSGQLAQTVRPGALMLATTVGSFVAIALFSLMPHWALGALCLALFGWLSAISSLLQYTLIQTQTPEHMLGRINGLWTAQNVTGDAIGAALLGGLGAVMTPAASASASGWALALVGVLLVGLLRELRRFQRPEIVNES